MLLTTTTKINLNGWWFNGLVTQPRSRYGTREICHATIIISNVIVALCDQTSESKSECFMWPFNSNWTVTCNTCKRRKCNWCTDAIHWKMKWFTLLLHLMCKISHTQTHQSRGTWKWKRKRTPRTTFQLHDSRDFFECVFYLRVNGCVCVMCCGASNRITVAITLTTAIATAVTYFYSYWLCYIFRVAVSACLFSCDSSSHEYATRSDLYISSSLFLFLFSIL